MKITKTQLKQIIMEELNETHYALGPLSVDVPDQYVMEKLAQVVDPIADVYNELATPEEQETFERLLTSDDPDLFAWIMGHQKCEDPEFAAMVATIVNRVKA